MIEKLVCGVNDLEYFGENMATIIQDFFIAEPFNDIAKIKLRVLRMSLIIDRYINRRLL